MGQQCKVTAVSGRQVTASRHLDKPLIGAKGNSTVAGQGATPPDKVMLMLRWFRFEVKMISFEFTSMS